MVEELNSNPIIEKSSVDDELKLSKRPSVMVVEDEDVVRKLIVEILSTAGYRVMSAHDGKAALEIWRSGEYVDLVITDVIMPEIGGYELATQIAKIRPGTKILYISGYSNETIENFVSSSGHFLRKPFTVNSFFLAINKLIAEVRTNSI